MTLISRFRAACRRWVQRLSAWFARSPAKPDFNWPTGTFTPLDTDTIAADLDLDTKAALNGEHGLPHHTDTAFDGPQHQIIVEINNGVAQTIADANVRVAELSSHIRATNVDRNVQDLHNLPNDLERTATNWVDTEEITDALPQLRAHFASAKTALQEFKNRHGLVRPPMDVDRRFARTAVFFFLVLQVLINANFFADAHPL